VAFVALAAEAVVGSLGNRQIFVNAERRELLLERMPAVIRVDLARNRWAMFSCTNLVITMPRSLTRTASSAVKTGLSRSISGGIA